jgi:hypothetical protein
LVALLLIVCPRGLLDEVMVHRIREAWRGLWHSRPRMAGTRARQ